MLKYYEKTNRYRYIVANKPTGPYLHSEEEAQAFMVWAQQQPKKSVFGFDLRLIDTKSSKEFLKQYRKTLIK